MNNKSYNKAIKEKNNKAIKEKNGSNNNKEGRKIGL